MSEKIGSLSCHSDTVNEEACVSVLRYEISFFFFISSKQIEQLKQKADKESEV